MRTSAAWLPLLQRDLDSAPEARVAQLGTVGRDGRPEVRSVMLRGVDEQGRPWFASDLRSAKFAGPPDVELCLWMPGRRVQWRVGGFATTLGADAEAPWPELRSRTWLESDPQVRLHLTGSAPGLPLAREPQPRAAVPLDLPEEPVPHFVLARVEPVRVERLALGTPHRRTRWHLHDEGWSGGPVMP